MSRREQIERASAAAVFYRGLGWNPLPSRAERKAPTIPYAGLWETPVSDLTLAQWNGPNVQVITGCRWGLCVVDLDGPEAIRQWPTMGTHDPTWVSSRRPDVSRHLWFTLPEWLPTLRSKGHIWGIKDGDGWKHHVAIELLADRKLAMAPPSIHPESRKRYEWLRGPDDMPRPAMVPEWLLRLPDLDARPPAPPVSRPVPYDGPPGERYDWHDVMDCLPSAEVVAADLGIRVTSRSAGRSAVFVHAIGREDANPSALINQETYTYWDPWINGGRGVSIFHAAVASGSYPDFPSAVNGLGARYGARPATNREYARA